MLTAATDMQTDVESRQRPSSLDVKSATSAVVHSRSSLISVADHAEHLTHNAIGLSYSHSSLNVLVVLMFQKRPGSPGNPSRKGPEIF